MSFEWTDVTASAFDEEMKLMLKSRLMAHRARRKILDWKIESSMNNIQKWEMERSEVSDREDKIADEIERRRL